MMEFLQGFNGIDYIFLTILIVSALAGLLRGGMREIISLLSWLAGFVVALMFSQPLAGLFAGSARFRQLTDPVSQSLGTDTTAPVSLFAVGVSFIVLFSVTVFVGSLIGRAINGAVESDGPSFINRLIGIIFGLGRGWLASLVLIFIIQLTPASGGEAWSQSKMVAAYQPYVEQIARMAGPGIEKFKKQMTPSGEAPISLFHHDDSEE